MKKTKKIKDVAKNKITDKQRLDFLQMLTDQKMYTGLVTMRMSETGRGWRLHETSRDNFFNNVSTDVRVALDAFMKEYAEQFSKVNFDKGENQ